MTLWHVYGTDCCYDIVLEESLINPEKEALLIKRQEDKDYIIGLIEVEKILVFEPDKFERYVRNMLEEKDLL
jgi:hypothetical protein